MRRTGVIGPILAALVLSACGGGGYSASDAASLYEAQDGAQNVVCKHLAKDRGSIFQCHAHEDGQPPAGMKIEIKGSEKVFVWSCSPVFPMHRPPGYRPPCAKIGVRGDQLPASAKVYMRARAAAAAKPRVHVQGGNPRVGERSRCQGKKFRVCSYNEAEGRSRNYR